MLCTREVYDALDRGSRQFDLGHTWDGAPLSCAVGAAAVGLLVERKLVEHVGDRGPAFRDELEAALEGCAMVREVRGRGFLLGVEYVDPRDGASPLPETVDAADLVDRIALDHGLLVMSQHATPDGFTGDHTVLAPAFTATDDELGEMVERFADAVRHAETAVTAALAGGGHVSAEFVLLGFPDVNGSLRGKALRPAAFDSAVAHGTVMTDLLLGLDPVDTPIADYERFGIRTGAADLIVHPDPDTLHPLRWRPGWRVCLATPSWPDGSPCEFASREVLRGVVGTMPDYDVLCRPRVRGTRARRERRARCRPGSATAWSRSDGTTRSSTRWSRRWRTSASSSRRCTPRPVPACSS